MKRRGRRAPAASRNGQGQNRTADTVIFSHVLYQLSYLAVAARDGIIGGQPPAAKRRPEQDNPLLYGARELPAHGGTSALRSPRDYGLNSTNVIWCDDLPSSSLMVTARGSATLGETHMSIMITLSLRHTPRSPLTPA